MNDLREHVSGDLRDDGPAAGRPERQPDRVPDAWTALRSVSPEPMGGTGSGGGADDFVRNAEAGEDDTGNGMSGDGGGSREDGSTSFASGGEHGLRFVGRGSALLWLYVVNLCRMILTLGVYSFWGKTRIRRYLWNRTLVFGDPLEYTGTGWQLCRSFLIVISLFFGFNLLLTLVSLLSLEASMLVSMAFMLVMVLFWPYALYSALRFRLARTNWRGIHGWLAGSPVEYAVQAWVRAMLVMVTLGLFTPHATAFLTRFIVDNASFGSEKFRFEAEVKTLARPYYLCWLAGVSCLGCAVAGIVAHAADVLVFLQFHYVSNPVWMLFPALGILGLVGCRLVYGVVLLNWRIRGVRFAGAGLDSRLTVKGYIGLTLSNWLFLALTLGIAWPWTTVRRYRYVADRVLVRGDIRWSDIRQNEAALPKSGEGLLSFLDLDLGF